MNPSLSVSEIDSEKYPIIVDIKRDLNQFDKDLREKNFEHIFSRYSVLLRDCDRFKQSAISKDDEYAANVAFILKTNTILIKNLAEFWSLCDEFDFPQTWSALQNALKCCRMLIKFCERQKSEIFSGIYEYLLLLESLFPYRAFASTSLYDIITICSICGRGSFDPKCTHIAGNLYWGEIATQKVVSCEGLGHIAVVPDPADKRCIIEIPYDKKRPNKGPFKKIHEFIIKSRRPFKNVTVKKYIKKTPRSKISSPEEWPCPCGSKVPFIQCCFNKDTIEVPYIEIIIDEDGE